MHLEEEASGVDGGEAAGGARTLPTRTQTMMSGTTLTITRLLAALEGGVAVKALARGLAVEAPEEVVGG